MERDLTITIVQPDATIETPLSHITQFPQLIEQAGRTCYKSEDRRTRDSADQFIRALISNGHESVIEHASITARIICDRSTSHQLVRHRIAAYSQESQRYCDYGKRGLQVICPPKVNAFPDHPANVAITWHRHNMVWRSLLGPCSDPTLKLWLDCIGNGYATYLSLREQSIPPEDARSVLPNATKTEVVTTFNLRQWRHGFRDRALNPKAQWQIREIMGSLLDNFARLLPCVFDDLLPTNQGDK